MHGVSPAAGPLAPLLLSSPASAALTAAATRAQAAAPHAGPGSFSAALHAALGGPADKRSGSRSGSEEVDAAARQAAHLAAPGLMADAPMQPRTPTHAAEGPPAPAASPASLEEILPALVRKIAWSGDARRGTVRIELGAGALAGATLLVAADDGRVQVTLSGRAGIELESWRERIATRLAARGLDAEVR
jgi:hypothetical protein